MSKVRKTIYRIIGLNTLRNGYNSQHTTNANFNDAQAKDPPISLTKYLLQSGARVQAPQEAATSLTTTPPLPPRYDNKNLKIT